MKRWTSLLILLITVSANAATKKAKPKPEPVATPAAVQAVPAPTPKPPVDTITFYGVQGKELGTLTWKSGRFEFKGDANKSAHMFFDKFLKKFVDDYLTDVGCPGK